MKNAVDISMKSYYYIEGTISYYSMEDCSKRYIVWVRVGTPERSMVTMRSNEIQRFNHLVGEIEAVYHETAWKMGLSDSVFDILYTICNYGDCCMLKDICRNSGLSKQTVNSALRKLEKEGIVYLELTDAKHKKVCLTEEGKKLARRTVGAVIDAENEILASWRQADVETYFTLTRRYLYAFQEKAHSLPGRSEGRML